MRMSTVKYGSKWIWKGMPPAAFSAMGRAVFSWPWICAWNVLIHEVPDSLFSTYTYGTWDTLIVASFRIVEASFCSVFPILLFCIYAFICLWCRYTCLFYLRGINLWGQPVYAILDGEVNSSPVVIHTTRHTKDHIHEEICFWSLPW